MGLFSASNLNALITNETFILGGTNIQVTTNGFTYTINGIVTNLTGLTISLTETSSAPSPVMAQT